ncbi:hypothetical protein BD414DRAFT_415083 [Trametes punicea]|nr:hypothetical protein BD414DRAFT_415083 [Trametes punicea]
MAYEQGADDVLAVGVQRFDGFDDFCRDSSGSVARLPSHRIETIVEAGALYSADGRSQAPAYANRFLRSFPDRVALYCLSVHWHGFRLYYADFTGILPTSVLPWNAEGLRKLASYVYSVHNPPAHHHPRDLSILWREIPGNLTAWSIQVNGEMFPIRRVLLRSSPPRNDRTVFLVGCGTTRHAIIKESYCDRWRQPDEAIFLRHIHCHGFIPGIVRLAHEEVVHFSGDDVILTVRGAPMSKRRIVLADVGESLLRAKTVNDLLMAVYDALEVHRTLALRAKVLHRDMSLGNVLMYPKWAQCTNPRFSEGLPPFIDDILEDAKHRAPELRQTRCLLIDFDYAATLSAPGSQESVNVALRQRVGTPMYVARAVAAGRVLFTRHAPLRMPLLSGDAKALYIQAYGQKRYDSYCDEQATFHLGILGNMGDDLAASASLQSGTTRYQHRWEYDVESVYWTMYSALLRVVPKGYVDDQPTRRALKHYWAILRSHEFLDRSTDDCENLPQDTRAPLLDCDLHAFLKPFPTIMHSVARLLFAIAQHIRISYAAMAITPRFDDHLHEAVQRLILDYLVRHMDDPIVLTPGELRISYPGPSAAVSTRTESGLRANRAMDSEDEAVVVIDAPGTSGGHAVASEPGADDDARLSDLLGGRWVYQYFDPDSLPPDPVSWDCSHGTHSRYNAVLSHAPPPTRLGRYRKLAPIAGVHVSPICLGAMSIGDKWEKLGMGAMNKETSFKLLDAYYEAGGNFIDTANSYQDESSEEFLGEWMELRGNRDQLVIATKYTINFKRGAEDILQKTQYTGNNLKSLRLSVEASLKKLRTDYIDILYVHWWDFDTTMEEVMNGLHNLVVARKVLYLGISDTPAWIVSKANLYARLMGKTPFVIYQGAWSILQRDFERDIIPMAREEGLALAPFNVLAGGRIRTDEEEERRRQTGEKGQFVFRSRLGSIVKLSLGRTISRPDWERTENEKKVCQALEEVAKQVGATSIQAVAIAYVMQKTPYVFPIVGGRKIEQLQANIEALDIALSDEQIKYLESILPFDLGFPHAMIGDGSQYNRMFLSAGHFDKWPFAQPILHGSLARAGKVKSQTPKVEKQEKKKTPKGRAKKRMLYNRRFVNVTTLPGGKRRM